MNYVLDMALGMARVRAYTGRGGDNQGVAVGLRSACVTASGLLVAWWAQVHTWGCVL